MILQSGQKEGKGNFDMSHLLPLSRWKSTPQPVREEFSESESESCEDDGSDEEKPMVIPRRKKKKTPAKPDSKMKFQRIPKRNQARNKALRQAGRKRKAPPPPPRTPPPQPFPKLALEQKAKSKERLKPSLFQSKQI